VTERIDPLRPIERRTDAVPAVRRNESSTEKRGREGSSGRKRQPPPGPFREPPPDDGRPHVDVTV
jgi:hypothetical protein